MSTRDTDADDDDDDDDCVRSPGGRLDTLLVTADSVQFLMMTMWQYSKLWVRNFLTSVLFGSVGFSLLARALYSARVFFGRKVPDFPELIVDVGNGMVR